MMRSSGVLRQLRRLARGQATAAALLGAAPFLLTPARGAAAAGPKNPYTILGIKQGASKAEIKKAYRVLARKHHPDAPGGSHERFQEIQSAYEQVKSGVWIRKEEPGAGGAGGSEGDSQPKNRYAGFRYTTRTHSKKVTYDQFYTEMHSGKVRRDPFADDEDEEEDERKDRRANNPFALNEKIFQAWVRFIILWCVVFMVLRVALVVIFPPEWERPKRAPPPRELRKRPPPPKPLARTEVE